MLQGNFTQEKKIELGTRWSWEAEATAQPQWAPLKPHSTGMWSHEIMQRCGTAQQLSIELRSLRPLSSHMSASFCLLDQPLSRVHQGCQNGDLSH